jgi:putative membrane protein
MPEIFSQNFKEGKSMRGDLHAREHERGDVLKGLAAGLVGGLVASWTMNQFQAMWSRQEVGIEKPHGAQGIKPYVEGQAGDDERSVRALGPNNKEQDDPTEKIAEAVTETVAGRSLKESEKEPAGAVVHYVFGIASGGLYGALAEIAPQVTAGAGLPFGAVFWLTADEIAVPALGLSKKPAEYPLSTHAYSLCSHLVYALTAEAVRRTVRKAL